jgi:hypothetical protein
VDAPLITVDCREFEVNVVAGNPGNVIVPVYALDAPLSVNVPQLPAGSAEALVAPPIASPAPSARAVSPAVTARQRRMCTPLVMTSACPDVRAGYPDGEDPAHTDTTS